MSQEIRDLIDVKEENETKEMDEVIEEKEVQGEVEVPEPKKLSFEEKIYPHLTAIFNHSLEEGIFDYDTEEAKLIIKSVDDPNQKKIMVMGRDPQDIINQIPSVALENGGLSEMEKEKRIKFFDSLEKFADHIDYQEKLISKLAEVLCSIIISADNSNFAKYMAGITKRSTLRSIFFDILCETYEQLDAYKEEVEKQKHEKMKESL